MAITHEDYFVSRAAGEWGNSSKRIIAIVQNKILKFFTTVERPWVINPVIALQ
jgi:hypothetical protein